MTNSHTDECELQDILEYLSQSTLELTEVEKDSLEQELVYCCKGKTEHPYSSAALIRLAANSISLSRARGLAQALGFGYEGYKLAHAKVVHIDFSEQLRRPNA